MSNILPASALILSVVNGLILFSNYLRDKAKLTVSPVHPEIYQYWAQLEDTQVNDTIVRRFFFLSYLSVANKGLRDVAVDEWRLHIENKLPLIQFMQKKKELHPYNIPEVQLAIGEHVKAIKIFGQNTQSFQSSANMVASGDSISGMTCWIYSLYGDERWNPKTDKKDRIKAIVKIQNVFGKKSECKLVFQQISFEDLKEKFPNLGDYLEQGGHSLM